MKEHSLGRSWVFLALSNLSSAAKPILILPIIVTYLGLADYGSYTIFVVTLFLVAPLSTLCIDFSLVRFLPTMKESMQSSRMFSTALSVSMLWSLLLTAGFTFGCIVTRTLGFNLDIDFLLLVAVAMLSSVPFFIWVGYLRGMQEYLLFSRCIFLQSLLEVVFVSAICLTYRDVMIVMMSIPLSRFAVFLSAIPIIVKNGLIVRPSKRSAKELVQFGLPLIPSNLFAWILTSGDRYVIDFILGPIAVATYSAISILGKVVLFISAPFDMLLTPRLSELTSCGRFEAATSMIGKSMKYFVVASVPALVLLLYSWNSLPISGLPDLQSGETSFIFLSICIGNMVQGAYSILVQFRLLARDTKSIGIGWGIASVASLSMNLALIPVAGISGAALAFALSSILLVLLVTWLDHKSISAILRSTAKFTRLSLTIVISTTIPILWLANRISTEHALVAFCVTYPVTLLLTRSISLAELKGILRTIGTTR